MAGFMAGFGKAFSEAYAAGKKRKFEEEQNSIQRDFQKAMQEQEFLYQQKLEDKRAAREAEKFARQLEVDRQNAEATRQFQMKMAEDNRQHDMNMSTANRTWEFLDDSAKERAALEKEQRERGYKAEDDKSALELYKEKDKIDTESAITLEKTKRGLDNEEKDIQARSDTNFLLETNPDLADPDGDGQVDPRVFDQIYQVVRKQGREAMEKMIEDGFTLDFGSDPKKSTNPAAIQNTGAAATSPASQQTDAMLASKSQPPVAASSEVALDSKPLPSTSPWKKPTKYDENISMDDAHLRLAQARTPEEKAKAEEYIEALKNSAKVEATIKAQSEAEAQGLSVQSPYVVMTNPQTGKKELVKATERNGVFYDEMGQQIQGDVRKQSAEEVKAAGEMFKQLAKPLEEYQTKVTKVAQANNIINEMKQLADPKMGGDERVLNLGGDVAKYANDFVKNMQGLVDVAKSQLSSSEVTDYSYIKKIEDSEKQIANALSKDVQNLALRQALFDAKATKLAFLQAAALGSTGRDVSNQDFNRFYDAIVSGKNVQAFSQNADEWLASEVMSLKMAQENLNQHNAAVLGFEATFGYKPLPIARGPEEYIKDSSRMLDKGSLSDSQQMPETNQMPVDATPQEKRAWYDSLPPGSEYIDDKGTKRTKQKR